MLDQKKYRMSSNIEVAQKGSFRCEELLIAVPLRIVKEKGWVYFIQL